MLAAAFPLAAAAPLAAAWGQNEGLLAHPDNLPWPRWQAYAPVVAMSLALIWTAYQPICSLAKVIGSDLNTR